MSSLGPGSTVGKKAKTKIRKVSASEAIPTVVWGRGCGRFVTFNDQEIFFSAPYLKTILKGRKRTASHKSVYLLWNYLAQHGKKKRRIYSVKAKNNSCGPSWRFDLVVSTSSRRFGGVVVCLVLQLWNIRNLGCFSWNIFESQICQPITRKDKKGITTKSVKGAKEAVENLSVEYFIGTFWLLIVYFINFIL